MPHEVSEATRHVMQANKSKNTKPELLMRRALREAGFPGYRLHWKKCAGRPDICYPGRKIAIFVNGCYWHRHEGCKYAYTPKSRVQFWTDKFQKNIARDAAVRQQLSERGIRELVIWECTIRKMVHSPDMENEILKLISIQYERFVFWV